MHILLYTASWCRDCREAKRFLEKHNLPFTEVDIENTPGAAAELVRHVGKRAHSTAQRQAAGGGNTSRASRGASLNLVLLDSKQRPQSDTTATRTPGAMLSAQDSRPSVWLGDDASTVTRSGRYAYTVSIIVVSFNTCKLLRECLQSLLEECARAEDLAAEILVVDNTSSDGSAEMVEREFCGRSEVPVRLFQNAVNLGFGAANNFAIEKAQGRYLLLVNSDAFLHPGALHLAVKHMDDHPQTALGGGRLVGRDGSWQPSGRCFHTILRDAFVLSGLSARFPRSRIFGAPDRTWADQSIPADVDWVPGAFFIMRREALDKTGLFDPRFFLYYEETDLCRRVKAAGYAVSYWPDVVVTHIGGESGRQLKSLNRSKSVSRVELWRMRSTLLYYRKHHGWQARLALWLELLIYTLRQMRNKGNSDPARAARAEEASTLAAMLRQAWRETNGGRVSPAVPW